MEVWRLDAIVSNCFNIIVNGVVDGISTASFQYANVLDENIEEFELYETLQIWKDAALHYEGWITSIQVQNGILTVQLSDSFSKMASYIVDEVYANTQKDDLKVVSASGTSVFVSSQEDEIVGILANDQYNGYYALISDDTLSTATFSPYYADEGLIRINNAGNTFDYTETNDGSEVDGDTDLWQVDVENVDVSTETGVGNKGWMVCWLKFNVYSQNIPTSARLLELTINTVAALYTGRLTSVGTTPAPVSFFVTKNAISSVQIALNAIISTKSYDYPTGLTYSKSTNLNVVDKVITLDPTSNQYFSDNGSRYEYVYVGYVFQINDDSLDTVKHARLDWKTCTLSLKYTTATFDAVNEIIVDTVDAGTDYLTFATDMEALGVAAGDRLVIGTPYDTAFSDLLNAYPVLPEGIVIDAKSADIGVGDLAYGASGYDLLSSYAANLMYHYWCDYTNLTPILKVTDEFESGGTLTGFTPNYNILLIPTKPGAVLIVWRYGIETYTIDANRPSVYKVQRKSILTKASAIALMEAIVAQYDADIPEITLNWDTYTEIRQGKEYTFTIMGTEYTLICKQVRYSQATPSSNIQISATFGGYIDA